MRKAKDPDLPDALRRTLDRLGRRTLAAVSRYAASRLGAIGGIEGGKKRWVGTTRAQRQEAARRAVMVRWARAKGRRRDTQRQRSEIVGRIVAGERDSSRRILP